jgi:primosomal protein N' (replication factor Y)
MSVARVAVPIAARQSFDYWVPDGLPVLRGSVVRVGVGARTLVGVVVEMPRESEVDPTRLRPIVELVGDVAPVPEDVLRLATFAADYYGQPLGSILACAAPPVGAASRRSGVRGVTKPARAPAASAGASSAGASAASTGASSTESPAAPHPGWHDPGARVGGALNSEQQRAAHAVTETLGRFETFLLHGVTGSGKTETYLAAAAEAVARGGQVLLLVPEINLTPQLAARVAAAFGGTPVGVLHSRLAAGARRTTWRDAAEGRARIVLGTRLAVFAPLPWLGLIVVDEEHDDSYRQEEGVRYHARDLAIVRARERGVPVVLASATPSLESFHRAEVGAYRLLCLGARAVPGARPPSVRFVTNRGLAAGAVVAAPVLEAIGERLGRAEQSLVFVNRRGFSPSLLCHACGWAACCPHCTARLVLHRESRELRCHHCGFARRVAPACPTCGNQDLTPVGAGTQRLEEQLSERFPQARIARVDRDTTTRRGAFAAVAQRVSSGEIDILVGTQMLAKGHDFPRLTLVAVLGADNALYSADFRATERLFAQLVQVGGRAGRARLAGEVLIQTDFAEHPLFQALCAQDYQSFARTLLAERRAADLPPYSHLALLEAQGRSREDVERFLADAWRLAREAIAALGGRCECFPPSTPSLARRAGLERGHLLVQSASRRDLHALLRAWRPELEAQGARRVRWRVDVDPADLG